MRILKKITCALTAVILLLTSTPVIALCEEVVSELNQPYTFSYEDETLSVEAEVSRDTVFTSDDEPIKNDEVHLSAKTDEELTEVFSNLTEDYDGEMITVDVGFCDEDNREVEQTEGETELTMTIPVEDENAVIKNVRPASSTSPSPSAPRVQPATSLSPIRWVLLSHI